MEEITQKNNYKSNEFRSQNENTKVDLSQPKKEIIKIIKKHNINYDQLKYLFKKSRIKCELKPTKTRKGVKEHLSHEDFTKLMNYIYQLSSVHGLMIKVLLFTGARVKEFVNIKVKDVYIQEKKIYLSTTKGDKPRYVPIFSFYLDELRMYLNNNNNTYLFQTRLYDKYSTRRIQQILKTIIKDVGIDKNITPHRLRGTIAVWLKEKGVSTELIQQFLGHSKLETTQIYTAGAVMDLNKMGNNLLENNS